MSAIRTMDKTMVQLPAAPDTWNLDWINRIAGFFCVILIIGLLPATPAYGKKKVRSLEENFEYFSSEILRVTKYKWYVEAVPIIIPFRDMIVALQTENFERCIEISDETMNDERYWDDREKPDPEKPLKRTRFIAYKGLCRHKDKQFRQAALSFTLFDKRVDESLQVVNSIFSKKFRKQNYLWFAYFYHAKADNHVQLKQFTAAREALKQAEEMGSLEIPIALERIEQAETAWLAMRTAIMDRAFAAGTVEEKHTAIVELGLLIEGEGLGPMILYSLISDGFSSEVGTQDTLIFPSTRIGESSSLVLEISNSGNAPETIAGIGASGSAYSVSGLPSLPAQLDPDQPPNRRGSCRVMGRRGA